MMFDKFTNRAKQVIKLAKKEALRLNHNYLGTEHLLLGLLKLGQGIAVNVLRNLNLDYESARAEVERLIGFGPEVQLYGDPALSSKVRKVFDLAAEEANTLNHNYIGTEHLLLALLRLGDGVAIQVFESLGVKFKDIRRDVLKELETFNLQLPQMGLGGNPQLHASSINPRGDKNQPTSSAPGPMGDKLPALRAYGHDLTELYREGKLDPVIGRKEEVERLIQILCRRRKNNPVLVGEAGVGKTAIVEGLAQAIVQGEVPDNLAKKKVISLDLTLMIAGTKYRGQFEERIKVVMDEVRKHGNILLFIDELHTIVGAGAAEGAIDASNILKPPLARGEIQCIGATTLDEYRKHIEKDAALERRFQKILILPPSINAATAILMGLKSKYEDHHKCVYTDNAIKAAVSLSDRYLSGRYLPDKAIDLLDEAGAKARVASMLQPEDISRYERQIEETKAAKEEAISKQEYENAANLRDKEKKYRLELQEILDAWENTKEQKKSIVDEEDIADIVAKLTNIPVMRITQDEAHKILQMEKNLQNTIVGQNEAIGKICRAIRRSRADIKDPSRPIGSFLFLGLTGVGKTRLARLLATEMFGGEQALFQVDMSEYMEKFAVSRMTGSPPGYVGHEEGGQLTEKVRQRPYCVVLFDEVEKAHPDVMNLLLQILEEGHLTDSVGRVINFRNSIVIMTSNLGADFIRKSATMGFATQDGVLNHAEMTEKIETAVKKAFKPELLNRLDDIVIFRALDKESLAKIVDLEIAKLQKRLKPHKMSIQLDESAKKLLVNKGFQPDMGARPLRRIIETEIEDPLAEKILLNPEKSTTWLVHGEDNKFHLTEDNLSLADSPTNG